MWAAFASWFPGLRQVIEDSGLGIVPIPADMQAESDAPDTPGPDREPEVPALVDPAPVRSIPDLKPGPFYQPRPQPPAATPAAPVQPPAPAGPGQRFEDRLEESLQATNRRLRREREQAWADAVRYARLLATERAAHAAARQLLADLKVAGIDVATFVDVVGTRVLCLHLPERPGHPRDRDRDLLYELPPMRTNLLYDLDGSTTSGGLGGPSGTAAGAGAVVDCPAAAVRVGEADPAPGGDDGAEGRRMGRGDVREQGRQ